jgi:enterochelin esterase-like enzyme
VVPTGVVALDAVITDLAGLAGAERDARASAFVREVAYTGGWPMRDAGRFVFAYLAPPDKPNVPSVVGDFNAWDTSAARMTRAIEGYGFFYAVLSFELPADDNRRLYKFFRDGEYFADPSAQRFAFDENGQHSLLDGNPTKSRFERWPDFKAEGTGLRPRPLFVYVPAGYAPEGAALPVLYMHDGQNLYPGGGPFGSWDVHTVFDGEIAAGRARPALVVGVANTEDRFLEYTHVTDVVSGQTVGGGAGAYVDFVADQVRPFVNGRYHTLDDRANTGVLGSSLGGLVSLYAADRRPEIFGFAGSMSGTVGWGSFKAGVPSPNPTVMDLYTAKTDVTIYLDSGGNDGNDDGDNTDCVDADGDGVHDDTPNAGDNFCENLDMRAKLAALGWVENADLRYVFAKGAQHNEAAWKARLPAALSSWFPGAP